MVSRSNASRRNRRKKKLSEILDNKVESTLLLLEFFNKEPSNLKEWNEDVTRLEVALALLQKRLTESVRDGVLLGLSKAFGNK